MQGLLALQLRRQALGVMSGFLDLPFMQEDCRRCLTILNLSVFICGFYMSRV